MSQGVETSGSVDPGFACVLGVLNDLERSHVLHQNCPFQSRAIFLALAFFVWPFHMPPSSNRACDM